MAPYREKDIANAIKLAHDCLVTLGNGRLREIIMTIRRDGNCTSKRPFRPGSINRLLPARRYNFVTNEEQIEGFSLAAYHHD